MQISLKKFDDFFWTKNVQILICQFSFKKKRKRVKLTNVFLQKMVGSLAFNFGERKELLCGCCFSFVGRRRLGFFCVLLSSARLSAFGFNHACHRSWRVYLEQMIRVALLLLLGCSSNSFLLWWSGDWWWDLFEKCHMSDLLRGQSKHWPSGDTTDRFSEKAQETLERRSSFWMMIVLSFVRISALISFFFF